MHDRPMETERQLNQSKVLRKTRRCRRKEQKAKPKNHRQLNQSNPTQPNASLQERRVVARSKDPRKRKSSTKPSPDNRTGTVKQGDEANNPGSLPDKTPKTQRGLLQCQCRSAEIHKAFTLTSVHLCSVQFSSSTTVTTAATVTVGPAPDSDSRFPKNPISRLFLPRSPSSRLSLPTRGNY